MKKVCKNCRLFVDGNVCSLCKESKFVNNYQGRISILDPSKSVVAKKAGLSNKGDFAIKFR